MTEPNDKLVEELADIINDLEFRDGVVYWPECKIIAETILASPIITRENLAAYHRGLRDAAAICDEVEGLHACYAAQRIRERLPC